MENRIINIAVVAEIAEALKDIREDMVFVGGAVVSLYTDDPAADEIRPTQDIDMTLNVVNLGHWNRIQEKLQGLGFYPDPSDVPYAGISTRMLPLILWPQRMALLARPTHGIKLGSKTFGLAQQRNSR
ncbi:MAG: hypothetical protein OEX02_16220 [Cyclobacteriaceae bacterium]|nr:hypothetical protein [Cyclobacteriaceae bacterium]